MREPMMSDPITGFAILLLLGMGLLIGFGIYWVARRRIHLWLTFRSAKRMIRHVRKTGLAKDSDQDRAMKMMRDMRHHLKEAERLPFDHE